jgi:cobalt/nickel transport system permease protein
LGILSSGAAWGEWSPQDFTNPEARLRIATASQDQEPPVSTPVGIERLSSIWTAPMPQYAPAILKNRAFGYMLSAMAGTGLIILTILSIGWVSRRVP